MQVTASIGTILKKEINVKREFFSLHFQKFFIESLIADLKKGKTVMMINHRTEENERNIRCN
jgi:hypothetical protein